MAFISSAKLLLRFNDLTLIDSISSDAFSVNGGSVAKFRKDDTGMVMERDKYIYLDSASLSITNKFTISYWLTPTWPGMYQNQLTNSVEPLTISLFDIGNGSVAGGDVSITTPLISVQEETKETDLLRMRIDIGNGAYNALSYGHYSAYDAHHFWIVYDGTVPSLTVYIDGGIRYFDSTGAVPASISAASPIVSINRMIDSDIDTVNNKGIIDEFTIFNDAITDMGSIKRVINEGIDALVDSDLSSYVDFQYGFMFDDPSAVRVNGAFNDGAYMYLARSDGKVAKGSPKFWDVRREFSNAYEQANLSLSDGISIQGDSLRIDNGTISI